MYPPAPAFGRRCVKEYHVPGSDLKLEQDCTISVPVNGLHHDPQFFPDPETFNPDRFSEDNKHNIQPFTYMPFGSGPRHCIGKQQLQFTAQASYVSFIQQLNWLHNHDKNWDSKPLNTLCFLKQIWAYMLWMFNCKHNGRWGNTINNTTRII